MFGVKREDYYLIIFLLPFFVQSHICILYRLFYENGICFLLLLGLFAIYLIIAGFGRLSLPKKEKVWKFCNSLAVDSKFWIFLIRYHWITKYNKYMWSAQIVLRSINCWNTKQQTLHINSWIFRIFYFFRQIDSVLNLYAWENT